MKLGFVLRRFGTDGGTEKYAADLAGFLVSRGHSVDVWCAEAGRVPVGVTVRPLEPAARRGLAGLVALLQAEKAVPHGDYDVVQGFGRSLRHRVYRAGGGVHAAWLAARDRTPAARMKASLDPKEQLELWIDREAMRRAEVVVFNSEMAARQAADRYAIPVGRMRVVRNGVDLARFTADPAARARSRAAWGVPDGGRVALFIGIGWRRKGLETAAHAFARAAGPLDRLVIVGRDAHEARWLAPIRDALGVRVVIAGATDAPEAAFAAADATILPTRYDSAANSTLEAMACGVPPVTSAADGNSELVPDRALVVDDPHDADGFARGLTFAWAGGTSLGEACRNQAGAWPVSRNGEAMESLYRELVDGQG
jgi:UDP-glucose:(heptosyl)LPS alpha-1,3-glucosyltransferase